VDIALFVLLVAGPIGAIDVIYFHLWKFRLFERPESVKEEITHIIRGFVAPTATGILLLGSPHGLWFWTVAALFALDALNSLLDVIFEPGSRAPRGVPPSELAIHFLGVSFMGAAWALYMVLGWNAGYDPTAIMPRTHGFVPDWAITLGYLAVAAAFALVIFETSLFLRAIARRRAQNVAVRV
jgi:hypothetical protein